MSEAWTNFIAIGGVLLAAVTLLSRLLDKSLSIREHEEYKKGVMQQIDLLTRRQEERLVIREFEAWIHQVRIDVGRIEDQIKVLDQTKPTTGELDRAVKAIDARLSVMEDRIKLLNHRFDSTTKFSNESEK